MAGGCAHRSPVPCAVHMEPVPIQLDQVPRVFFCTRLCSNIDALNPSLIQQELVAPGVAGANGSSLRQSARGKIGACPLAVSDIIYDPVVKFQNLCKVAVIRIDVSYCFIVALDDFFRIIQIPRWMIGKLY